MAETNSEILDEPKKSKKGLIIGLLVLLMLIAGGVGGYFFLAGGEDQSEQQVEEEAPEEQEPVDQEVIYFEMMKPLIVNFVDNRFARLIQISLAFRVRGEEMVDELKKHEPMIRNNLLMLISKQGAEALSGSEGKLTLQAAIKDEINQILSKMSKRREAVDDVFFTTFVMQ